MAGKKIRSVSEPGLYRPRLAESHLTAAADVQPVVVVMGARQTGKSTLVCHHPRFGAYEYLTLDSADVREQAHSDPAGLLARGKALVLDEIQRAPELVLAVKEAVDRQPYRTPGQFILTGSANLLHMKAVGDTLAGRASYTTLWPLTRRERLGHGNAGRWDELLATKPDQWRDLLDDAPAYKEDWRVAARRSAYPTPALTLASDDAQAIWMDGYADTYIDRDVTNLAAIAKPLDLRRLMRHVCVSVGQVGNQLAWGAAAGVKRSTVSRYLDLLETSYQLVRVPAFAVNRTKRLTKSPKIYWSDTALAMRLAGINDPTGFHLENLIVADLLAWSWSKPRRPEIMHWRTTEQVEVDLVIEMPHGGLLPIEVKSDPRPTFRDTEGLRLFLDQYPETPGALVMHGGTETYMLGERIVATPWWRVV